MCPPLNSDSPSQSSFFVETSGHMCLTARQACSVESAAWMNPDLPVRVYQHDRPIGRPSGLHPSLGGERRQDFRRRPPVPQLPTSPMKQKEIIDRQQQQRIQTFRFFPKLLFIPLSQLAYVSHCLALLLFIAFNSYLPFKNKNTN